MSPHHDDYPEEGDGRPGCAALVGFLGITIALAVILLAAWSLLPGVVTR
jgi:hypothetical protein